MANKASVKIDGTAVHIDPQLMYQRLIVAVNKYDNIKDIFRYELSTSTF